MSPQCSCCPCVEAARLVTSSRWFPGDSVGNIVLSPRQEQVAGGWSQEGSGMLRIIVSTDAGAHRTPPHTAIISMDPGTLRLPRQLGLLSVVSDNNAEQLETKLRHCP